MVRLFVLFPAGRRIWETFCNFWHFSWHFFSIFFRRWEIFFCFASGCAGGAVAPAPAPGPGSGRGELVRGEGGARFDLLYLFLLSGSKVSVD